jgi:phosphoribosylaminoimidazole-succinocarboxamide synthase
MTNPKEILKTNLGRSPDYSGKVRDIYDLGEKLLIVATDRLSAYDRILPNGVPGRGKILTEMSVFWFAKTKGIVPNHLISANINDFPMEFREYSAQLEGRTMLCSKAKRIDIECVARGYLAGSGWKEYKNSGTVCGIKLPDGLRESDKLPEPIFTPATKAEDGAHDENISFEKATKLVGSDLANELKKLTLEIYTTCADYAIARGIIIADTKFEFGYLDGNIILIDEILSPDSSRFWDAEIYEPGKSQESFDKQFVRDWLTVSGFTGDGEPPRLPDTVIVGTLKRYLEVQARLMK